MAGECDERGMPVLVSLTPGRERRKVSVLFLGFVLASCKYIKAP